MEYRTLGTVATYINGRAFKPSEWEQNGLPIIRIQNLNDEYASYNYCSQSLDEKFKVKKGDLLFAWSASLGAHIWNKDNAWLNQHIFKVIPDKDVNKMFLYYYLCKVTMELYSKAHGTGMVHITKKPFMNTIIPLPPLAEQERIVAKIEELFSELDNAVETLNATKTQLEVYRQAVLKEAFEGKLTAKWRERNNIDYSFNKVNIKALVKKEKNSLKAGPFGSSLKKEFYVSNGYKIYGQEQVIAGDECIGDYYVNEEKYQELITCKVSPRDVLISLVGTVGKVLILSRDCKAGLINPRLIKISLDENIMIPEYFKYYFESDFIKTLYKSKVHGATMDVLNMSMIKEFPFLLCSIKEQEQIIYEIESRMSEYYNIENTVNIVLQQATAMRQSILKQAFEGRLL